METDCLAAGAIFLAKPIRFDHFSDAVAELLAAISPLIERSLSGPDLTSGSEAARHFIRCWLSARTRAPLHVTMQPDLNSLVKAYPRPQLAPSA
jgi:hypothetical protein